MPKLPLYVLVLVLMVPAFPARSDWWPSRAVELISEWGVTTIEYRTAVQIAHLEDRLGLFDVPIIAISGLNGPRAIEQLERGQNHTLLLSTDSVGGTLVATMGRLDYALWSDGDISTPSELLHNLERNPETRIVVSNPNGARIAATLLGIYSDSPLIEYRSDRGEAVRTMTDGDALALIDSVPRQKENWNEGGLTPILQFSESRSERLPDTPTAIERGLDVIAEEYVLVSASDHISDDALFAYHEFLKVIFRTSYYQEFCRDLQMACDDWRPLDGDRGLRTNREIYSFCPECGAKGKMCDKTCPSACNECEVIDDQQCCRVDSIPRPEL